MTSTEEWNYQASIKFGPNNQDMLNIRAASAADLAARCEEMEVFAGEVVRLARNIDNVELLPPPNPATAALASLRERWPDTVQVAQTPAPVAQPQTYGPPPTAPLCPHGQMKFIEKVSAKTGQPYKAYFCPADRNAPDKCDPRFVN